MKYLNFKWINYEVKGWLIVLKCTFLNLIVSETRIPKGPGFKRYYANSIAQLSNYMTYGEETGLQKISDSCWWNKR